MTAGVRRVLALLALFALWAPISAWAQAAPLVLEVSGGAALPLGSLHDGAGQRDGTSSGPSFGVDLALSGSGRRTLFVGFSQHRFGCVAAGCRAGESYVATGADLGVRVNLRTSGSVIPWIRLGALTTRVEMPAGTSQPAGVSKLGAGGDVGFGVFLGASSPVALNPGVRYAAVNSGLPGGGVLRLRYLVAELSVVVSF